MKLWIARDPAGTLLAFDEKPYLVEDISFNFKLWTTKNGQLVDFWEGLFPEVTFENSPQQVEINIVKYEKD